MYVSLSHRMCSGCRNKRSKSLISHFCAFSLCFLNLICSYRHEFYRISRDVTCVWRRIETVAASSRSPGSCSTAQTKLRTETCSSVRSGRGVLCRPGHCSHRHQAPACHPARPRSPFVPLTLCTAGPPVYVLATRSLFAVLPRSRRLQCDYCRGPGNCSATVRRHGARLLAVHGQPDIALQDCTWPRLIVRASACTLWPLMCARPARTASIGVTSPDTDSAHRGAMPTTYLRPRRAADSGRTRAP